MSLSTFHQIFIAASIVLTLGMGIWSVDAALSRGDSGAILLGVISGVSCVVLVFYGLKVRTKLKQWRSA
jgi:hypothetical protein